MFLRLIAAVLLAAGALTGAARAEFPERTITLLVSFPPGGLTDIPARILAPEMQQRLGQSVIVENKAGASGITGGSYVVRSAPDGYTLLVSALSEVQNFYYLSVPYNALTDLVPVGKIVDGPPLVLIVNAKSRFKSLADLIAFAKEKPDKGTGPATSAVVTGDVQASFVFYPSAKGLIDGGQLRVLAVTSEQRMKSLPEVPTMEELGFKGFKHTGFVGLSAPKGTPPDVIAKLNKALNDSLQSAAVRERLEPLGMTIPAASNTAEAYGAYMAQEAARQGELAKLTGHALQK